MSRKITANLYMTLDGRGAFPKYPGWDRQHVGAKRDVARDVAEPLRRRHHRRNGPEVVPWSPQGLDREGTEAV